MNKYLIGIFLFLIVFLLAAILLSKRRDLPFQEVIALDKGIAVVNAQQWFMKDLKIVCRKQNRDIREQDFDDKGVAVFFGLENGHEYTITIYRTDLKGRLLYKPYNKTVKPHEGGDKYYILVGASIGKNWKFEKLPERLEMSNDIILGNRTIYQFNKTKSIKDIINLPFPVTGVIIKECSAYFPRNLEESKKKIFQWIELLKAKGIQPFLATTVPITEKLAHGMSGRQNSLEKFNDFIRQYGKREATPVLDLEKALRKSRTNRHLREDFAREDGVHLVDKAYKKALDPLVLPLLKKDTINNGINERIDQ